MHCLPKQATDCQLQQSHCVTESTSAFLCRREKALAKGGSVKAIEAGEMQDPEVIAFIEIFTKQLHLILIGISCCSGQHCI